MLPKIKPKRYEAVGKLSATQTGKTASLSFAPAAAGQDS